MTSYPARITNVSKQMNLIFDKQTVKPDEFHIYLAEPEFPNREIPEDLKQIVETDSRVFLHWLPKNTYCHKKHEYFKIANQDDLVFMIDDDVQYESTLFETVLRASKKFPNTIICFHTYHTHKYQNRRIVDEISGNYNFPRYDTRICTQCMIPACIYPKEALNENLQEIRDKLVPICDETWLNPFLVHAHVPIYHLKFNWEKEIDVNISIWHGTCTKIRRIYKDGKTFRDVWLENVLNYFPEFLKEYQDKFNY